MNSNWKTLCHVAIFVFPHHTMRKYNDVVINYCPTYLVYSKWTSSRFMDGLLAKVKTTFWRMDLLPTCAAEVPEDRRSMTFAW